MAQDTVSEIKERLSIQDVIGQYVKLKRAGRSLVGLCPFHKEKTPSFHISPERGSWHCFGCGLGGDAFSFIEKIEGVDFKGALNLLAERAGVPVVYQGKGKNKEEQSRKERLLAIMTHAADWYARALPGTEAERYALERGLTKETIATWSLGYAPDGWRTLLEAFVAEGYTVEELLAAGLIKEADGKPGTYYDRFRARLMFPIRDSAGQTVAFTGRILKDGDPAKYLNSPETLLFHKSDVLFGMDRAKDAIRTRGFAMLVEGQMDVLMLHQTGFENAVALSGTALSERHLALMKRFSDNLMLVLDADTAGLAATARSAHAALSAGLRVKAVTLTGGKDPAEMVLQDARAFTACVKDARPIVDFFLAALSGKEKDTQRLIRSVEGVVLPLIRAIQSPMERDHFIQATARVLDLSEEAVRESLRRLPDVPKDVGSAPISVPEVRTQAVIERRRGELIALVHAYPDSPLAGRIKTRYFEITEATLPARDNLPESVVFEVERLFGEEPSEHAADELLRAFEEAVIREAYEEAVTRLRKAESAHDADAVADAQAACTKLATRLANIGR